MNSKLRGMVLAAGIAWIGLTSIAGFGASDVLPDPKAGGAGGGALSILFLGPSPMIDKTYAQELAGAGFAFTNADYYEPLTYPFLRKFDVIVIDKFPMAGAEWDTFGQRMIGFWTNMTMVWRCAEEGAGVLVYGNLADNGGGLRGGWNAQMKRWGIALDQSCVIDPTNSVEKWRAYGDNWYCWTERLAPHPVTEGLKRIYYAAANLRWDDCYTAPPLVGDKTWTPLLYPMPTARVATLVGDKWIDGAGPAGANAVLAAVRSVGKGRLGVLSINPAYVHEMGYTRFESRNAGEMSFGVVDGIVLTKGNGTVPSDTGRLVSQMYRWLAGNSVANGHGGYRAGDPVQREPVARTEDEKRFTPTLDFDALTMPRSWRHRPASVRADGKTYFPEVSDPLITGELRFFKGLIGPHSELSDGKGSVAEWAAAARKAGYAVLVFAENFEKLSPENWTRLASACETNTSEDLVCLPGIDIMDPDGNHFLLVAPPEYPRAAWLSEDGKRLVKTQMINLLYFNHMVVAHRPQTSPLPQERLKHFQGLTIYTYRGGKIVDDGFHAYAWQVMNASNPHPIVVHELFSPEEVAGAAAAGFQQLMPADTPANAAGYFRVGIAHYFESPSRYMISEGPVADIWTILPKDVGAPEENRRHFRVDIGVTNAVPLASVELYDGPRVIRHWTPNEAVFRARVDFQHTRQYDLFLVAADAMGRRVITSSMRTVADRYHFRCSDRQNWLGHVAAYYTGVFLPERLDVVMRVKGTAEGSGVFNDVPGACMAEKLNFPFTGNDVALTEAILDEKYKTAVFNDVGLDAMPSLPSEPSTVYSGRMRFYSFTPGKASQPWVALVEYDLALRRDAVPADPAALFPAFGSLRGAKYCGVVGTGRAMTKDLSSGETLAVPRGTLAGGYIALSDGLQVQKGMFGMAAPKLSNVPAVRAGTKLQARFLLASGYSTGDRAKYTFDDTPEDWLRAMGLAGTTPYAIKMDRGKLDGIEFVASMTAENYGVAGTVAREASIPYDVPLRIAGINENWVAGSWRTGEPVKYTAMFEGAAWPRLDVSRRGNFYAGNLLLAGNKDLVLEIVKWDRDGIKVEAHNPTAKAIQTTVVTPKEIAGYKALNRRVTVPAGSTMYVE